MRHAVINDQARVEMDPLEGAAALFGGRWKFVILWHLLAGPLRFAELRRCMPLATPKNLLRQLQDLERRGLVMREASSQPHVWVEYSISSTGRTLEPILLALEYWSERYDTHRADAVGKRYPEGK
ncbi:winged helix-turn-helix transcriptional regulator [Agrobacterium tumefaciens]|uniref:winged helix-turn-helix transcriptional regulator n=1 Tax=Agrobacterium tumefaciens TaxID=358 RepID=UPI0022441289|nr:helix-turn-helix domain-containing protein [Agrobacterium tumefaciens]MCW8059667.1 helix-turn-helix transcriptional regulator [Agrobacterium tumefaciens]MCW8146231.1 helix-turn-helix transcriptional regulator [Agrobacterium tumefaciens]